MRLSTIALLALPLLLASTNGLAEGGDTWEVLPGSSIQSAIDASAAGDVIVLREGRYDGDIDFGGKALTIRGAGPGTVLAGSGGGPVVMFQNGEGAGSVLDSVTVRGGRAAQGGGILIRGASPVVVRCVVTRNRASVGGSGIFVGEGSQALIVNNLVTYNRRQDGGDPHGIEISSASPLVAHNTICRGDSNGIITRGDSAAAVLNNVIAWNGARVKGRRRGRGICDFSGGRALIAGNVFHRNLIAALLRDGKDWRKARRLEESSDDPFVFGNSDGSPGLRRAPAARAKRSKARHFDLRRKGRAVDGGLPVAVGIDIDGSRADAGWTGGPFAEGGAVPAPDHPTVVEWLSLPD